MTQRSKIAGYVTLLASLMGAAFALYLIGVHIDVKITGRTGGALCNLSGFFNCNPTAQSSWSSFLGIPIALLGLGFYVGAVALAATQILRDDEHRLSRPSAVLVSLFGLSVAYSLFLATVAVVEHGSLCPGCMGLYAANAIGLIAAWTWNGSGPHHTIPAQLTSLPALLGRAPTVVFLVLFALVVAVGQVSVRSAIASGVQNPPTPAVTSAPTQDVRATHAPSMGPANAPVTMVLFSDFQCPYCARFAKTLHEAHDKFPEALRIEFRHFPLPSHQHATAAARLGACVDREGRFWDYHDIIYAAGGRLSPEVMAGALRDLGLDPGAMAECAKTPEITSLVDSDKKAGQEAGVKGTPAFFVNGSMYAGAYPLERIEKIIQAALASSN